MVCFFTFSVNDELFTQRAVPKHSLCNVILIRLHPVLVINSVSRSAFAGFKLGGLSQTTASAAPQINFGSGLLQKVSIGSLRTKSLLLEAIQFQFFVLNKHQQVSLKKVTLLLLRKKS